jgi:hypothetical protein
MLTLEFKLHHEIEFPQDLIDKTPSQGPFDSYAEYVLGAYDVQVSLDDSIAYLKCIGAWDLRELQDLELNKGRLVWIALLDCKENETNYWYMGE